MCENIAKYDNLWTHRWGHQKFKINAGQVPKRGPPESIILGIGRGCLDAQNCSNIVKSGARVMQTGHALINEPRWWARGFGTKFGCTRCSVVCAPAAASEIGVGAAASGDWARLPLQVARGTGPKSGKQTNKRAITICFKGS